MEASQYSAPVSRPMRVVVGLVLTIMGGGLLALFALLLYALLKGGEKKIVVGLCIIGTVGVSLCVVGIRLITGRRRRDGGLFSPWVLRFAGVFFIAMPLVFLFAHRTLYAILESGLMVSAGVACFVVANRREQDAADDVCLTIVGGDRESR
jgi:hypothetical protein